MALKASPRSARYLKRQNAAAAVGIRPHLAAPSHSADLTGRQPMNMSPARMKVREREGEEEGEERKGRWGETNEEKRGEREREQKSETEGGGERERARDR